MRLLFFGTSSFAVPILESLAKSDDEVIGVVSQPDKPTGRGMQVSETPVKKAAVALNLPVYAPEKARAPEFLDQVRELNPDALIVAAYGQILSQKLLDIPPHGGINVHGSLLPKYRGAAPIQRAILEGETVTGNTIMQMDKGMDTGDMLLMREIPIDPDDTYGTLEPKLAQLGAEMIVEALSLLKQGKLPRTPQNNDEATYAPMIQKEEAQILWTESAARCRNRIRAFSPRPGAYTYWQGKYLKIWQAEIVQGQAANAPGEIISTKEGITVSSGENALKLLEVQPEGKPRMAASAFANGYRISPGMNFNL